MCTSIGLTGRKIGLSLLCIAVCLSVVGCQNGTPLAPSESASIEDAVFAVATPTARMSSLGIPFAPPSTRDPATPTPTPSSISSVPVTTSPPAVIHPVSDPPIEADLSPEMPRDEKTDVIIRYPDGREVRILVGGPDSVEKVKRYLAGIDEEVMLVTIAPPASMMGHQPPTPDGAGLRQSPNAGNVGSLGSQGVDTKS